MRVLIAHNYYQQPGGEDYVFHSEAAMLESRGHDVYRYSMHNDDVGKVNRAKLARTTIWNQETYEDLRRVFREHKTDVAHFHNTILLLSPAAYYAAKAENVAVVQTLHNYRLHCLPGTFFRNDQICEDCFGKSPMAGVRHSCYRESRMQSIVLASMLMYHRSLGTYQTKIDRYIALTEYARKKFHEGGIPIEKIAVKPNFLEQDPGMGAPGGDYMIFIGRLTKEKGILTLLNAWRRLQDIPLKIVGDGPLMPQAKRYIELHNMKHVELLGHQPRVKTMSLLQNALSLIFPSEWNEPFPLTIVEGLACGKAIVAAKLGAPSTVVENGKTGLYFEPRNANELAAAACSLWMDKPKAIQMGAAARKVFEEQYTAEHNYEVLMGIYEGVLAEQDETMPSKPEKQPAKQ